MYITDELIRGIQKMMFQKKGILVTKIQRFSLHDGPGIRTTVFLKGCSVHCPWCSNPENLSSIQQYYIKDGIKGEYGIYYDVDVLYEKIMKDELFFKDSMMEYDISSASDISHLPGGVTFSGGEPLLQMEQLQPLLERFNKNYIHMAIETALFTSEKYLYLAIKYINFFYIDIKILNQDLCKKYLGGNLDCFIQNLNILMDSGKPVIIRIPVIGGYTEDIDNRKKIAGLILELLQKANVLKVELLKEHNLALSKYQSLIACNTGYSIPEYKGVSDELMELYRKELMDKIKDKIPVEICNV